MRKFTICVFALAALAALASCGEKGETKADRLRANSYVARTMGYYYLWEKRMPQINTSDYSEPKAVFNALRDRDDKWSAFSNDADSFINSLQNTGKSFGYQLKFFYYAGSSADVYAVVEFVFKGSPAEKAGIVRGDYITACNGTGLTDRNYTDLYNHSSIEVTLAKLEGETLVPEGNKKMTAAAITLDPIVKTRIFESSTAPIGYLFYSDYVQSSEKDLLKLFGEWKDAGVRNVIIDLRSNGGGTSSTAELMMNVFAPENVVQKGGIVYTEVWNDIMMDELRNEGILEEWTEIRFDKETSLNLDLSRIFFITSGSTASASELTILGLKPFMEVNTIGTRTHGKYVGGIVLPNPIRGNDGLLRPNKKPMGNRAMYLITFRYANSLGNPSFYDNDGIAPTLEFDEDYMHDRQYMYDLGDTGDDLIYAALTQIDPAYYPARPQAMPAASSTAVRAMPVPAQPLAPGRPSSLIKESIND